MTDSRAREASAALAVIHEIEFLLLANPKSVQAEVQFFTLPPRLIGSGREAFVSVFSTGVRPLAAALYERVRGNDTAAVAA